jgi:hypothetical protein
MRTSDRAATTPVAPQSIQSKPRIAQSVVKTPLSVRFPGLEEFGTIEFDAGPPQKPGETLKKTICGLVVQCLKKIQISSRLKRLEEGRSEKSTTSPWQWTWQKTSVNAILVICCASDETSVVIILRKS